MNKSFVVLIIVIFSYLKKEPKPSIINPDFTNLKKIDLIKNSKNYKRTFSNKIFRVFGVINDGKKPNKIRFFNNFIFVIIFLILNNFKKLFQHLGFDFNSLVLLFFGCCVSLQF